MSFFFFFFFASLKAQFECSALILCIILLLHHLACESMLTRNIINVVTLSCNFIAVFFLVVSSLLKVKTPSGRMWKTPDSEITS